MDSNHTLLTESRLLVLLSLPGGHLSEVHISQQSAAALGWRGGRGSGPQAGEMLGWERAQVRVGRAPLAPTGPPFPGPVPAGRGEGHRCQCP